MRSLEQVVQHWDMPIELDKLNDTRVSTWVQEKPGHCVPVSMEGCHHWREKVGMGGKHVRKVMEGLGKVWLESWTLS